MAEVAIVPAEQESNEVGMTIRITGDLGREYFAFESILLVNSDLTHERILEIIQMRLEDMERAEQKGQW